MNVAFYAPLKAVDHPVPSGDREMARAFMTLLDGLGHDVRFASTLRSFDKAGSQTFQQHIAASAEAEIDRLGDAGPDGWRPDLWFTYHAYHKAPDLLGPRVARKTGIPYVVAEASIAGKQASGPWADGHRSTIDAVNVASAVLAMTEVDARELARYLSDHSRLHLFPPFLTSDSVKSDGRDEIRRRLADQLDVSNDAVWLVTVAMMRSDVKRDSYRLLANTIAGLPCKDWHLLVVGSGEAAAEVRSELRAAAGDNVRFLGELPGADVAAVLQACDVFVWPALREAYGMAILEALAAGLPVIACDEGGVGDLVGNEQNGLLAPRRSPRVLRQHLQRLIGDAGSRQRLGARAAELFSARHSRRAAEIRLAAILGRIDRDHCSSVRSACN
jgi:glycosyltransferase involved in cell wall biosynthesis